MMVTMRYNIVLILFILITCHACEQKAGAAGDSDRLSTDQKLIDSLKKEADSIYSKPYLASGFAKAEYMINSKDSTITQVMTDSVGVTRQVVIVKNKRRIYTAQYYANGQLKASYAFDASGQYHGATEEYWENGLVKEAGYYSSGLRTGIWKRYDSAGIAEADILYDKNGQPHAGKN
jgi:antitoxin component YwqK of YwqJK toxin-antitoxin module